MRLEFIGADHEVTGSCHYIEACGKHILVDYGMEQGINVFENVPLPVSEAMIDYVFLHTHMLTTQVCFRYCMREASGEECMQRKPAHSLAASCFVTVRIYSLWRQSGRTEKLKEAALLKQYSLYIVWRMPMA